MLTRIANSNSGPAGSRLGLEYACKISTINSKDEVQSTFAELAAAYGWIYFGFAELRGLDEGFRQKVFMLNWPWEWADRYFSQNYVKRDLSVRQCFSTNMPFTWASCEERAKPSSPEQQIFGEAREMGLCDGLVIPTWGPDWGHVISLSGRKADMGPEAVSAVHLAGLYAAARWLELDTQSSRSEAAPSMSLSAREIEVLKWQAAGKSDSDIADILGISVRTAKAHSSAIKTKLGAASRVSSVMRGREFGLID